MRSAQETLERGKLGEQGAFQASILAVNSLAQEPIVRLIQCLFAIFHMEAL